MELTQNSNIVKKLIFGLIATVFFGLLGNAQRFSSKDLEIIGIEHNRLLDLAYGAIKSNQLTDKNKKDLIPVLQKSISESRDYSKADLEQSFKFLNQIGTETINLDKNFYSFSNSSNIDKVALPYYDKLYAIVMKENLASKEITAKIETLETEIYNDKNIDNKQLIIFYSGSNVAKYSYLYWEQNTSKWQQLNPSYIVAAKKGSPRRVAGADVIGGIAGATTCWMANAVPGAGQAAYGTAIAVGAVGFSMAEAGSQFMDWMGW